jgi:PAS domain S-box-containing protein
MMGESVFADERIFHLIVEASPAGMIIADEDGIIVLANRQANKILGYSSQELIGKSVELLIPDAHRSAHTSHRARYMSHREPREMAAEQDLFAERKDGSQVAVDISLHPIETATGAFVLANILDATARRRSAREHESREAIERLAQMGQLAGGVAHEIRTPLCVIRNNTYYLQVLASELGKESLGKESEECCNEINRAIDNAERIVRELLSFTGDTPSHRSQVRLSGLIQSSVKGFKFPEGVELRLGEVPADCWVHVDEDQISRTLANLLTNAVQAIQAAGVISVRSGRSESHAWIEVADSGPGISPDEKERVFEPLYTTRASGIGLGLSLSRRYAEANGGSLIVTDDEQGGACFRLNLPLQENATVAGKAEVGP